MISDGADTAEAALGESLLALKSPGVPVFTVGVGRETLAKDIQIGRVNTPRTALKGTTLMVDVIISQTGFAGKTVTLDVEDEGRIVGIAAGDAAGRWRRRRRSRVRFTRQRCRARASSASASRRRTASWSPRTTRAKR